MSILDLHKAYTAKKQQDRMSLEDYLGRCKEEPSHYDSFAQRMLKGIGKQHVIDTSKDEKLGRIFVNRKLRTYPEAFHDFFGIENVIENIVAFYRNASLGLEESKQVLYLMGPVGAAKSSLAERLKHIAEKEPFYTIEAVNKNTGKVEISPIYESPLGLFNQHAEYVEKEYKIPNSYLKYVMSPWAALRLAEADGDLSIFKVVKVWPSILNQIAIARVEPGDPNNQDITTLVGGVNINKLGKYDETSPDSYGWNGGLNRTTQGILEFVEMFKADITLINPMLSATQDGSYNGTKQIGAIPYQGQILAHSNETEWKNFKNEPKNEAFIDRIKEITVPYCLRVTEEAEIYHKMIKNSKLAGKPCAPGTLEMMAQYSVLTRLKPPENSSLFLKMEVYDGKNMKSKHPSVKAMEEYKTNAGVDEGMKGSSTRFAFKILSSTFDYDIEEQAANPIHLMQVLEMAIRKMQLGEAQEKSRLGIISDTLKPKYFEFLQDELQRAYIENRDDYCQNLFERYINYADSWIEDKDYTDPDTGLLMHHDALNQELEKIEKPAEISNPKEFRNEVARYTLRNMQNNGKKPRWDSYEKIKEVIEKKVFTNMEELLPVITFGKKSTEEEQRKHNQFIERMQKQGYTPRMIKLAVDWYLQANKSN